MLSEWNKVHERGFQDLSILGFYSTTGDVIATEFIEPVLNESISFDRLTGYFSVHSIVSVARGIQGLFTNSGKMRLVIGIHDVPPELISAMSLGQLLPEDLVNTYKNRLYSEIDLLNDESQKSAISGLAWMIRLGVLEVKVAAPKTSKGIFHQKRMIFRDRHGNVIAGTGSLNETMGSRSNVEEMQFNLSWESGFSGVNLLVNSFEDIWSNNASEVIVFGLDEEFATKLLLKTGNLPNPYAVNSTEDMASQAKVLELARSGVAFSPYNLSSAVLYPHQERVFSEALSRWPIRVLMADEVGLGKTLEAGTAISYLHKFKGVKEITILVPAGLIRQWQEELLKHFNLDFWRWDSGGSKYVSAQQIEKPSAFHNSKTAPMLRIVSAQWARMRPDEFSKITPQLLVVDEAHAARVNENAYGTTSTQLWKLVKQMSAKVPHLILLTATPMQVHPSEFHGLLLLLGLPVEWQEYSNYEESLKIIADTSEKPNLQKSVTLANLILSAVEANEWMPKYLNKEEMLQIMELREASAAGNLESAKIVMKSFHSYRTILIKIHPGHFFTCRNTKSGLKQFGYVFPDRKFSSPEIFMPSNLNRFTEGIENYLSTAYGTTEEALVPKSRFPISFAKSSYYQRLVSSLYAANESLRRRRAKILAVSDSVTSGDFDLGLAQLSDIVQDEDSILDSSFYDDLESKLAKLNDSEIQKVQSAARSELLHVNQLLSILNAEGSDLPSIDPKFKAVMDELERLHSEGPVLVFSRYTDTLNGFLSLFEKSDFASTVKGYSLYTGGNVWIKSSAGTSEATKSDVTDALDEKKISIVFCSDAASEGLNLQSAQSLINIDVPWNPARLEQRIGRIARLGQKSKIVHIVNVWYPNSIEARMYSKLLERKDDYELAVGEFPDIFSESIRNEVNDLLNPGAPLTSNIAADLVSLRQNFQTVALKDIWETNQSDFPASREMRNDFLEFVRLVTDNEATRTISSELTSMPGTKHSIGLNHEALDTAVNFEKAFETDQKRDLFAAYLGDLFISFAVSEKSDSFRLLKPLALGRLLKSMIGEYQLSEEDFADTFMTSSAGQAMRNFLLNLPNLPQHSFSRTEYSGDLKFEELSENVRFEKLGFLGLTR